MAHAVGRPSRPVVVARLYQRSNRVKTRRKKDSVRDVSGHVTRKLSSVQRGPSLLLT